MVDASGDQCSSYILRPRLLVCMKCENSSENEVACSNEGTKMSAALALLNHRHTKFIFELGLLPTYSRQWMRKRLGDRGLGTTVARTPRKELPVAAAEQSPATSRHTRSYVPPQSLRCHTCALCTLASRL